jgi:hypothetical protein
MVYFMTFHDLCFEFMCRALESGQGYLDSLILC